jgi:hypothetical protein
MLEKWTRKSNASSPEQEEAEEKAEEKADVSFLLS